MFRNLQRVFLLSVLVLGISSSAFATTSRVRSLAETGNYINDDSNIFRWYGTLPYYADLLMAEVGSYAEGNATDQALGVTYSCGENAKFGTWGVFLLRNDIDDNSFFIVNPLIEFTATPSLSPNLGLVQTPVNKFALSWGKEFDNLSVGFSFVRSHVSEEDSTGAQTDPSFTTLGAGVRADFGESAYSDFAVTLGFGGGTTQNAFGDSTDFDKKTVIDMAARLLYEWKDNVTVVPFAEYLTSDFSFKVRPPAPHGDKMSGFKLGASMNIDVNTNNLLICAIELSRIKWEFSDERGPTLNPTEVVGLDFPKFYLALESSVKSWLTARVGASKAVYKSTSTYRSGKDETQTGADFNWYLGAGFEIADFIVDVEIGPELPFNMGYWLTGYSDGTAPITRMSVAYHF